MKNVLVVIPAFNEAPVIADVVKGARELFEKDKSAKIDILVVDDKSSDATASEAKKSGAKVISHILNTGAGGATLTGLGYARQNDYDIVATMDADGQHSAKDVLVGIKKMLGEEDIDLLIGSRLINSDGMSKTKVIGNKGLSTLTHLLFGISSIPSNRHISIARSQYETGKPKTEKSLFANGDSHLYDPSYLDINPPGLVRLTSSPPQQAIKP